MKPQLFTPESRLSPIGVVAVSPLLCPSDLYFIPMEEVKCQVSFLIKTGLLFVVTPCPSCAFPSPSWLLKAADFPCLPLSLRTHLNYRTNSCLAPIILGLQLGPCVHLEKFNYPPREGVCFYCWRKKKKKTKQRAYRIRLYKCCLNMEAIKQVLLHWPQQSLETGSRWGHRDPDC